MADSSSVEVTDVPEQSRYEARVDGELAGVAVYELGDGQIVFTHTKVDDAFEGHGVGSALARAALDDVAAREELTVVPQCPFIEGWIDKHPEYAYLVEERHRG